MEEKKNSKLILIIMAIIILVLISFIVIDKVILKNDTNTSAIKDDEKNSIQKEDYTLNFASDNNYFDVATALSGYSKVEQINDLIINDIKLEDTTHFVKIKNYNPEDSYKCKKGKDKVLYFDEQVLYEPEDEACYLTHISNLIVLDAKYLLIHYSEQNDGFLLILDKNGNKISVPEDMVISSIGFVNDNSIYFQGWKENEECYSNLYKLQIINDTIQINEIEKSTNFLCS